jgi:hypothetical protein
VPDGLNDGEAGVFFWLWCRLNARDLKPEDMAALIKASAGE